MEHKEIKPETISFPRSRIVTFDVGAVSRKRHLIPALLEVDVTDIRKLARANKQASLNSFLLKIIADTLLEYSSIAGFKTGKTKLCVFSSVSISIAVEKEIEGRLVPIPLVIRNVNEKTVEQISAEIDEAKKKKTSTKDIQLDKKASRSERLFYSLPAFTRRQIWKLLLKRPGWTFDRMGNVSVTSLGMFGKVDGWFIHTSIHPVSIGLGSVLKKARVINNEVVIREILNMTILFDHDITDGAIMARFVNALVKRIEHPH